MKRLSLAAAFVLTSCFAAFAQQADYARGLQYHAGDGVVQNYATAAGFFAKAAARDYAPAQNFLGRYLFEGLGVPQDKVAAMRLLEQAAQAGDPQHLFDLAKVLEEDDTTVTRAAELYEKAAAQGHTDAAVSLGVLYQQGRGVPQDFGKAFSLYKTPAEQGHARALNNLGLLYVRGTGVPQDYATAADYFAAAAEAGLQAAMKNLGVMYENGYGVPLDEARAAELYRLAARGADSGTATGYIYDKRLKSLTVTPEALEALSLTAKTGEPVAQFQLGWFLIQPQNAGFENEAQAARLFEAAAKAGYGPAMINLGVMYARGAGVPQDYVLAQMWLLLGQAHGAEDSANAVPDLAERMTASQVNTAQAMASQFFNQQ